MREGVSKKYREIKAEFVRAGKQKALEYLEEDA
jgi:hypothetical protein